MRTSSRRRVKQSGELVGVSFCVARKLVAFGSSACCYFSQSEFLSSWLSRKTVLLLKGCLLSPTLLVYSLGVAITFGSAAANGAIWMYVLSPTSSHRLLSP